ncbi:MAG: crosslink repair DNA glycosylase YcaQ family protein [Microthrixaceae bacterium]
MAERAALAALAGGCGEATIPARPDRRARGEGDRGDHLRAVGWGGPSEGELVEACRAAGIELDGSQAGHILRHLTETMRIVLAGAPGNEDEFCAGERLVDDGRKLSGEDALRELAVRFFSSRGPATAQCFSWWTNLTMGDTRRALDAAGDELQELDLLGERFVLGADADIPDHPTALELLSEPLLLAPFDEYLLAYRSRDAAIDPEHLERVVPGRNGMFKPIVVAGRGGRDLVAEGDEPKRPGRGAAVLSPRSR